MLQGLRTFPFYGLKRSALIPSLAPSLAPEYTCGKLGGDDGVPRNCLLRPMLERHLLGKAGLTHEEFFT